MPAYVIHSFMSRAVFIYFPREKMIEIVQIQIWIILEISVARLWEHFLMMA